ncbi:Aspartic proteinase CDR1 [Linum perenne]
MSISLGTPPVPILAIADTGSDVVWTQCKPCPSCYVQNDPLFDPASSSTYQTVPCSSKACSSLNNEGVSTPLISDPTKPTFYFLNLEGVSVGEKRIPFQVGSSSFGSSDGKGNIIIDSGTTLTILPAVLVSQLSEAVESQIVGGKKAEDPQGDLSLCYVAPTTGTSLGVPRIIFHFQGADVELPSSNVFIQVSGTVTCFAFYGSDDATIYGNVAQQNFLVGYDIQKKTLSFKPTDCARN